MEYVNDSFTHLGQNPKCTTVYVHVVEYVLLYKIQ